jgi:hypothetical protein
MKNLWYQGFGLLLVAAMSSSAQAVAVRQPDRGTLSLITDYVNNDHQAIAGVIIKQFTWMGDSAASAIMQVIGKQPVDKPKLERILGILHAAFERPGIIRNSADRSPTATLTLLNQLQRDPAWDASALAEIDSTRQFVIGVLKFVP